jgi:hypothetical protein
MINQQQLVDVLCSLTEDDFKQIEDIIKQLHNMFDDESLSETIKNKVGVEKMQTLEELLDDKYDEEVTIAVLVSKFKSILKKEGELRKSKNTFCSKSCSAIFNNKNRDSHIEFGLYLGFLFENDFEY